MNEIHVGRHHSVEPLVSNGSPVQSVLEVMSQHLLSEGWIDQNKLLNHKILPAHFPLLNWEQLAEIETLLSTTRVHSIHKKISSIPNQQVEFTVRQLIDPIQRAFPNVEIQLIGESLNAILRTGDYLNDLFQMLNLKMESSETDSLFDLKADTLDVRIFLKGGVAEDIRKIEVFITSFFQLQTMTYTNKECFYKKETTLYPVSSCMFGIECHPKNNEDTICKVHFHIDLENNISCLGLKEAVSWQFIESNGSNPWLPLMEALMTHGNIPASKVKENRFSLLRRSTLWSDKVLAQLQYSGILGPELKVRTFKLPHFPKINENQIAILDSILDKARTTRVAGIMIEFTLRDLISRIQRSYPGIEIQLVGSTVDFILRDEKYIEELSKQLKIDVNVHALKSLLKSEPGDVDLRLVLSKENERNIHTIMVCITSYFQLKAGTYIQPFQMFNQFITPIYPINTGLIAISCDKKRDSVDLFFEMVDLPRLHSESFYLSVDPRQTNLSEFKGQRNLSPWVPFIHLLCKNCSADEVSDNVNLFTLIRCYHQGFRTLNSQVEQLAYKQKQKNGIIKQSTASENIFHSFKKYLKINPEKAIAYYFQSSLLMHEYGETRQIPNLWKKIQLECNLNDPFLQSIYNTLHKSPHLFLEIFLTIQVFCAECFVRKDVVVNPLKVFKTMHKGSIYAELQYLTGFMLIPLRPLLDLQAELEHRRTQLSDDDKKLLDSMIYTS